MKILPPLYLVAVGFDHDGRYEFVTQRMRNGAPLQVLNLVESKWDWEWENAWITIARWACQERAATSS